MTDQTAGGLTTGNSGGPLGPTPPGVPAPLRRLSFIGPIVLFAIGSIPVALAASTFRLGLLLMVVAFIWLAVRSRRLLR